MLPVDHARLATLALARGIIDARAFGEAMMAVGELGEEADTDSVWVASGRLSAEQLSALSTELSTPALTPSEAPCAGGRALTADPEPPPRRELPGGSGAAFAAPGRSTTPADPAPAAAPTLSSGEAAPADSRRDLPSIVTVPERYRLAEIIGQGGMGEVTEAVDRLLDRRVALKALHGDLLHSSHAERMLFREARVTGSLEHPGIVPVYDVGALPEVGTFYTMRLVEQASLAEVLRKLRAGDAATAVEFTLGRLLRIFIQVCQAVDYAHSRRVIHCDLKPANILLGSYGEVLVADWGLAFLTLEGTPYRGGTPGFMAPEQCEPGCLRLDARADVFALGAILYEILTLEHAFDGARFARPTPPRERAPDREIAEELDAACMKALEIDLEARLASAHELAVAIEAVLEGTRERDRRRRRADELARQADNLIEGYRRLVRSRPGCLADIEALRSASSAWGRAEEKRRLWEAEDRLLVVDRLAARKLHAAIAAYEQARSEVPGHARARDALKDLYAAELARAEERGDDFDRVWFEALVRQTDDGAGDTHLAQGTLRVEGGAARLSLAALEERDRRLVPADARDLGRAPTVTSLAPGRYVISDYSGAAPVRYPVSIRTGGEARVRVVPPSSIALEPDEVLVPGGPARLGGDGAEGDLREIDVATFAIARFPVRVAEYLEFVAERMRADEDAASPLVPTGAEGLAYWRWESGGFVPAPLLEAWRDRCGPLEALPVFGVTALAAAAFADWRSRRTGRRYRLPTEDEWEKAARGTDGRRYPWGDRFDASFCKMRESRPAVPYPEPSGAFPFDESPYGVRDLGGGVADWTIPRGQNDASGLGYATARGGAWTDWHEECHLGVRRPHLVGERSARVGFRLARSA